MVNQSSNGSGMTPQEKDTLSLIAEIAAKQRERADAAKEAWSDLAPFGHRSANVKRAEAEYYLEIKRGDKPPSDRIIDEMAAHIGGPPAVDQFGISEARERQREAIYLLSLLDADLEAMKTRLAFSLYLQSHMAASDLGLVD